MRKPIRKSPCTAERIHTAISYYRRGYSIVDAAGNAGCSQSDLSFALTKADHKANRAVWA